MGHDCIRELFKCHDPYSVSLAEATEMSPNYGAVKGYNEIIESEFRLQKQGDGGKKALCDLRQHQMWHKVAQINIARVSSACRC